MARMSEKVKNYVPAGKGDCKNESTVFDAIQNTQNTLFDIRCSMKKKWGYEWYEYARYGCYNKAREALILKPACLAKSVALKCIDDLEMLRDEMSKYEMKGGDR